jgi:hypothetical protein
VLALQMVTGRDSSSIIERAKWLSGCWMRHEGNLVTEEQWMSISNGTMLGMSRTTRGGKVAEYEYLRLFERDGRIIYHAFPSGQASAEFTSDAGNEAHIVFENPAHDFPQRIIYRPVTRDSMVARIEGPGSEGTRGYSYRFRRTACPGVQATS